ncbi:hypothetical protein PIB30_005122 [Stylosanthes scabra]|uniref:Bidirectional sugar transporter SWEET n=1 Tax=Stylosanthes scabra TaxID=79078 RepID=A0ABU6Q3U0_9FABA|nr:hypothetical protein [Stylosanthes scabra]
MAELSFFVGIIGNMISVLMFLSPVDTFWRIIKKRSTEDFSSVPYICTLLNTCLWTYYGLMKPGEYLVATVNAFGVLLQTIYITIFLIYAPKHKRVHAIVGVILDLVMSGAVAAVTQLALEGVNRINAVGLMGAAFNILMYGSPLTAMKTVVMRRSVEYMPFLLSFFFFLNGAVWFLYAFLLRDPILGVPNGAGFILGSVQLVLYGIYKGAKSSNGNKNIVDDQQSLNENLIISSSPQSHV